MIFDLLYGSTEGKGVVVFGVSPLFDEVLYWTSAADLWHVVLYFRSIFFNEIQFAYKKN